MQSVAEKTHHEVAIAIFTNRDSSGSFNSLWKGSKMKNASPLKRQVLALVFLLAPTLAHAESDYTAVEAMFAQPRGVGKCTVEFRRNQDASSWSAGHIVIKQIEDDKHLFDINAVKDEKIETYAYSLGTAPTPAYYRFNWLPEVARNGLTINKDFIRIDHFTWLGLGMAGLDLLRVEIRLDGNGNPVSVSGGKFMGFRVPLPFGKTYSEFSTPGDGHPFNCD